MRITDLIERVVSESDYAGRGWIEASPRFAAALAMEHDTQVERVGPAARGVCVKLGPRYMQVLPADGMPDDRAKVVCPTGNHGPVDLCRTSHERLMLEAALRNLDVDHPSKQNISTVETDEDADAFREFLIQRRDGEFV